MTIEPLGRALAWTLVAIAILANVVGYASSLYERWWWFDRVLHAFTIGVITLWLGLFVFLDALKPEQVRSVRGILLLLAVGVAIGGLWEVAEWAFDEFASGDVIKGKHDTILDIVMDTLGALVAVAVAMACIGRRQRTGVER